MRRSIRPKASKAPKTPVSGLATMVCLLSFVLYSGYLFVLALQLGGSLMAWGMVFVAWIICNTFNFTLLPSAIDGLVAIFKNPKTAPKRRS